MIRTLRPAPLASAIAAAVLLATAATAHADVIITKDDRRIEGEIIEETEQGLTVKLKFGTMTLDRKDIKSIERKLLPIQELRDRRRALAANDADGRADLARFAIDREMPDEAIELLLEAIALKPAHRKTRQLLEEVDYHETADGRWLSPDEYYPTIGWVKRRGRWMTREEAALLDATAERREVEKTATSLDKERRGIQKRIEEATDAVAKAQARLVDAENKVAQADSLIAGIRAQLPSLRDAVLDSERRVAEARGLLNGFLLQPAIPGETDLQRQARLQRQRDLQVIVVQEESELRRRQRALDQANADIAELESFRARGPAVIEERRAAIATAQANVEAERARERELDDQIVRAREAMLELDVLIRDLKDAKKRAEAAASLEKKKREAGVPPRRDPTPPPPEPEPPEPDEPPQ